jgi:hypothetical protein
LYISRNTDIDKNLIYFHMHRLTKSARHPVNSALVVNRTFYCSGEMQNMLYSVEILNSPLPGAELTRIENYCLAGKPCSRAKQKVYHLLSCWRVHYVSVPWRFGTWKWQFTTIWIKGAETSRCRKVPISKVENGERIVTSIPFKGMAPMFWCYEISWKKWITLQFKFALDKSCSSVFNTLLL